MISNFANANNLLLMAEVIIGVGEGTLFQSKKTSKKRESETESKRGRFSVCVHEACHAIVAHVFGFKVYKVTVRESKNWFSGRALMEVPVCPVLDSFVTLAGSAGEVLWQTRKSGEVSVDDWKEMRRRRISGIGMALVIPQLNKLLKKNKKVIYRVAKALNKKGTLLRKEFLELL